MPLFKVEIKLQRAKLYRNLVFRNAGNVLIVAFTIINLLKLKNQGIFSRDSNWDLLNYHLINGFLFSHPGFIQAIHPATIQSFHNPLLDILISPLLTHFDNLLGTTILVLADLGVPYLVFKLGRKLAPNLNRPALLAASVLSLTGSMAFSEIGQSMGDLLVTPILLYGLLLCLDSTRKYSVVIGGTFVGAAIGLKLSVNSFVFLPLVSIIIFKSEKIKANIKKIFMYFVGNFLGFIATYGWWGVYLQKQYQNPFFPYWNKVFKSEYFSEINFRDERFIQSPSETLSLAFRQFKNLSASTSELPFQDSRWLLFQIVFCVTLAVLGFRRLTTIQGHEDQLLIRLSFGFVVSYIYWALNFGIQRYIIPLEAITPLLIISLVQYLIDFAKIKSNTKIVTLQLAVVAVLMLALSTKTVNWGKTSRNIDAMYQPASFMLPYETDTYLLAGQPTAYLAVIAKTDIAKQSLWFSFGFNDADDRSILRAVQGKSISVIYYPYQEEVVYEAQRRYGLKIAECKIVGAPVGTELIGYDLKICKGEVPSSSE